MSHDYWDYPSQPIGGGNPYQQCVYCKLAAPTINGELEGHLSWCKWRRFKERELVEGIKVDLPKNVLYSCFRTRLRELQQESIKAHEDTNETLVNYLDEEISQINKAMQDLSEDFEEFEQ